MPDFGWNLLATLTVILVHGAGVYCALRAAERAHTAEGGLAWAIPLVLLPWVTLPLYAVFGPTDTDVLADARAPAREEMLAWVAARGLPASEAPDVWADRRRAPLEKLAPVPIVDGPAPHILIDGHETFDAIFAEIAAATATVHVQFYIVRDDGLGRRLKAALEARARDGVRVLFLYDAIGCHNTPSRYWEEMAAAGVEVRPFEIARRFARVLRLNFRNHRKAVIVDGRVAFVGGPNVGDEYLGLDPAFGDWRDTSVRLTGAAAAAVEASFREDWAWSGGDPMHIGPAGPPLPPGGSPTLILPTGPADMLPACTLFFCHLIAEARERLWIATPYFVPDLDVLTSLKLAALRGVDVRVLIPHKPDHTIVWLAAFAYAEETMRAGIGIWRYREGFMHQKICLVDDWAAAVGTVNLDNRSLHLNFEITALVFDKAFAAEVAGMLERDFGRSLHYDAAAHAARPRWVRVLGPAARLAGPLL